MAWIDLTWQVSLNFMFTSPEVYLCHMAARLFHNLQFLWQDNRHFCYHVCKYVTPLVVIPFAFVWSEKSLFQLVHGVNSPSRYYWVSSSEMHWRTETWVLQKHLQRFIYLFILVIYVGELIVQVYLPEGWDRILFGLQMEKKLVDLHFLP